MHVLVEKAASAEAQMSPQERRVNRAWLQYRSPYMKSLQKKVPIFRYYCHRLFTHKRKEPRLIYPLTDWYRNGLMLKH